MPRVQATQTNMYKLMVYVYTHTVVHTLSQSIGKAPLLASRLKIEDFPVAILPVRPIRTGPRDG